MPVITRTVEVNDLSPHELAALFCEMSNDGQANFFERIWEIAKDWPGAGWCQQSFAINEVIADAGKDTIITLARHILDRDDI